VLVLLSLIADEKAKADGSIEGNLHKAIQLEGGRG
jgi:hypothetical protein